MANLELVALRLLIADIDRASAEEEHPGGEGACRFLCDTADEETYIDRAKALLADREEPNE